MSYMRLKVGLDKKDKHIMAHDSKYCLAAEALDSTGKLFTAYAESIYQQSSVQQWYCYHQTNKLAKLFANDRS